MSQTVLKSTMEHEKKPLKGGIVRAGTYAKADISSRSWLQTPVITPSVTTLKGKKKITVDAIINPIFSKCAELTTDTLWKDIFIAASIGKYPRGFGYQDGTLFFRKRTRTMSVEVSPNPLEALEVCRNFFRSMGGIASQEEHDRNDSEETGGSGDTEGQSDHSGISSECDSVQLKDLIWSKITPKKNLALYLNSFVGFFGRQNRMTSIERELLQKTLNLANTLNLLNDSNIIMNSHSIVEIKGLSFDPVSRKIIFPALDQPFTAKRTSHSRSRAAARQGLFTKLWDKYLTSFNRKIGVEKPGPKTSVPTSIPTAGPKTVTIRKIQLQK